MADSLNSDSIGLSPRRGDAKLVTHIQHVPGLRKGVPAPVWRLLLGRHGYQSPSVLATNAHPSVRHKKARIVKDSGCLDKWCGRLDLNQHASRHTPLKRTCLPFHHDLNEAIALRAQHERDDAWR